MLNPSVWSHSVSQHRTHHDTPCLPVRVHVKKGTFHFPLCAGLQGRGRVRVTGCESQCYQNLLSALPLSASHRVRRRGGQVSLPPLEHRTGVSSVHRRCEAPCRTKRGALQVIPQDSHHLPVEAGRPPWPGQASFPKGGDGL